MTQPAAHPPPPPPTVEDAIRRVRESGGRVTAAKRAIIGLLHSDDPPQTADDFVAAMGDHDRSVVYRNLAQLEALGIAEHVHRGHGQAVYRPAGLPTVPVVCGSCGSTRELDRDRIRPFTRQVADLTGIELDLTHLPLTGTCTDCASIDERAERPPTPS